MEERLLEYVKNIISISPLIAYIFFFLNASIQILFPPYPGDTITIFSGYLSSKGFLNSYLLLISTLLGTYSSSLLLYLISFKFRERLLTNKFIIKYYNLDKIVRTEKWFKKYGSFAIIINKFLPGISSITLIAAGIFKLPHISAFISIGIATCIHNTLLFLAGRLTGDNINFIKQTLHEYNRIILFAILIILIPFSFFKYFYKKIYN